jgi:putative aminopeptidase FrvX
MFDLLKKLCNTFGVSGNEEEIRDVITDEIKNYVDEIKVDPLGNLIAIKKGKGKKIMIAAHMDEIGVMATYIDDKGFIRFTNIGGVSPYNSIGQRVKFKNNTIGAVSYEEKLEDIKNLKLQNMYIDIGSKSKKETEERIRIGDTATFIGDTLEQNGYVISKALDNRSGCAVAIKAIQCQSPTENEVYYVFTVQEELGLRGAKTSAYQIMPDFAIVLDVTSTGDKPESDLMEVKLGQGPAIKIKDRSVICHPKVKKILEDSAKSQNIPFQYEILERGGTDAGSIHLTGGGIPSGVLSLPSRYVHSPAEMASLSDIENAVKILAKAVL